ncbi:MAG: 5-carboxymethyl-2-hydroxymuconate Delta-isomerase [Alcaligenaceae bacterium]|nr:5-carboxymethyl-2-hydroxymuconate Delta-isomerase [Alcaligenaceae bacterium]
MPHLTIEYSGNLRDQADMPVLMRRLSEVLIAEKTADGKQIYPTGGIRVRAIPYEDYCIAADQIPDAGFVHTTLRIGPGRTPTELKSTGDHLFEAVSKHFADLFEHRGLSLSLAISEFPPPGTWKQNNLHRLLKKD